MGVLVKPIRDGIRQGKAVACTFSRWDTQLLGVFVNQR
jgi:hypothetical protein